MSLRHSPAAERNRAPILHVLWQVLPATGRALEIGSGTGQHVAWFAAGLPSWEWQPSDADAAAFGSITGWCDDTRVTNVLPPVQLDVRSADWGAGSPAFEASFDAIFSANMLHIAPWSACTGLMRGAARHLSPEGLLVAYGPFWEDETPPADSNLAFDKDLRNRNPAWGIRRLADVNEQARKAGLVPASTFSMPSNNLLLVFRRAPSP